MTNPVAASGIYKHRTRNPAEEGLQASVRNTHLFYFNKDLKFHNNFHPYPDFGGFWHILNIFT